MTTGMYWPFRPDWAEPVQVIRSYRTEIITSRSGREARRSLRSTPRKTIELRHVLKGADLRKLKQVLSQLHGQYWLLLEGGPYAVASSPIAPGDTATVESVPSWLPYLGQPVYLVNASDVELMTVDNVAGSIVTFQNTTLRYWPAGTKMYRGTTGVLNEIDTRRLTSDVAEVSIRFDVLPGNDPVIAPPASSTTFNGREVLTIKPNWAEPLRVTHRHDLEIVDFQQGVVEHFRPVEFPTRLTQLMFNGHRGKIESLIDHFDRMQGQRGEFYLPSWENDLPPLFALSSGASTLTVEGTDVYQYQKDDPVLKALAVILKSGQALYRSVTAIDSIGGNSVLTVSPSWSSTIAVLDILMVSWMPVHRHSTDSLTIDWLTDGVGQLQFSVQSLEDLAGV